MELNPQDLRIDTFHAERVGGWSTATPIAVRITHVPTGLTAERSDDRSVHKNKAEAFKDLTAKVAAAPGPFKSPFAVKPWREEPTAVIIEAQYDLYRAGFDWISNDRGGVHLQVVKPGAGVVADLWPTTGRWTVRNKQRRFGKSGYNGAIELIEWLMK